MKRLGSTWRPSWQTNNPDTDCLQVPQEKRHCAVFHPVLHTWYLLSSDSSSNVLPYFSQVYVQFLAAGEATDALAFYHPGTMLMLVWRLIYHHNTIATHCLQHENQLSPQLFGGGEEKEEKNSHLEVWIHTYSRSRVQIWVLLRSDSHFLL